MTVIDVHTHMLTEDYLSLLDRHGGPKYRRAIDATGVDTIRCDGAPFFTLDPAMWDYERRIRDMDSAGVDLAIVSLTCPNAFFGEPEISLAAAGGVNDSMAEQQTLRPNRIRWLASLPWQYPKLAITELARAVDAGAVGVMVIATIDGKPLTDPAYAEIWVDIDRRELPVLVHPGPPVGAAELGLADYALVPAAGFPFDTTVAFARLFVDGFLDRYPNLKLIAAHGGGALPYLAARLDRCHEILPAASIRTTTRPSEYLGRIFYDAVVYSEAALRLCIDVSGSDERVLFGSDYPHTIGDMPGCLARTRSLAPASARRIQGGNAEKLFRL
jgi:aminocarboxymuconate-semialdehyde decarboxylase